MKYKPKKRLLPSLLCAFVLFFTPIIFSACEKGNLSNVTITQTPTVEYDYSVLPEYRDFKGIAKREYLVPGMVEGFISQGIDVWEEKDLLLISGYFASAQKNFSGSPSSMLLSVDLKTGEFVGKYCIKTKNGAYYTGHNGGLAVTEKNIFIAETANGLGRIPLSQIEKLGTEGTLQIVETIKVTAGTSFINCSNGVLWVGKYANNPTDYLSPEWMHMTHNGVTYYAAAAGYVLTDTESEFSKENWDSATMNVARPDYYLAIPNKVQGFTFFKDQFVLSTSHGRTNDSHILVYDNVLKNEPNTYTDLNGTHTSNPVPVWFLDRDVQVKDYSIMPMSEGVCVYNDKVLIVFESATIMHKGSAKNPTDWVWSMALTGKED